MINLYYSHGNSDSSAETERQSSPCSRILPAHVTDAHVHTIRCMRDYASLMPDNHDGISSQPAYMSGQNVHANISEFNQGISHELVAAGVDNE